MRSSIPILWRLTGQRYRLTGAQCRDCGHKMIQSREVCPVCAEGLPWAIFDNKAAATMELRPEALAPAGQR